LKKENLPFHGRRFSTVAYAVKRETSDGRYRRDATGFSLANRTRRALNSARAKDVNERETLKNATMKIECILSLAVGLCLFAGCASSPETSDIALRTGMTSGDLKLFFGEPVRVQPGPNGGADWYYRFAVWNSHATSETGVTAGTSGVSSYVSESLSPSKDTVEEPVHVSSGGYVIEPLPDGKILKN